MAKLLLKSGDGQVQELFLRPGLSRVGRNGDNDIHIEHPSVSSFHCEINSGDDSVIVKDLGSTNGTFIEGAPIQEACLMHGQRLQLGLVEMFLDAPAAAQTVETRVQAPGAQVATRPRAAVRLPQPSAPAESPYSPVSEAPVETPPALPLPAPLGVGGQCKYHPRTPARWACKGCQQLYCDLCVASRPSGGATRTYCRACGAECSPVKVHLAIPEMQTKGFYAHLPGAFTYPFKKNGLILLIAGVIFFAFLDLVNRILPWRFSFFILGFYLLVLFFATGYFLSYMQRIMTSSGYGDEEMPSWPEFSDFWQDVLVPVLLLAGTVLACVAPGLACLIFGDDTVKQAAIPLFVLGGLYFPMAVLAVGMTDNIFSLNPLVIIPSIAKVFVPYVVGVICLGLLYGVYRLSAQLMESVHIPLLSSLIISFLSLYFTTVQMRILGLLYFTNKDRLGWFSRG